MKVSIGKLLINEDEFHGTPFRKIDELGRRRSASAVFIAVTAAPTIAQYGSWKATKTAANTWDVTGDVVKTASATAHGCSVYASALQTITAGTPVILTGFDSENFDTDAYHDTVTNKSRITIPTGLGGKYIIISDVETGTLDQMNHVLYKNGSLVTLGTNNGMFGGHHNTGGQVIRNSASIPVQLVAGDYVEIAVLLSGSGSRDVTKAIFAAIFQGA